jgi:hypothetical protein
MADYTGIIGRLLIIKNWPIIGRLIGLINRFGRLISSSLIFALVQMQYVSLTNKYIKMGGTMRSVGGTQNM